MNEFKVGDRVNVYGGIHCVNSGDIGAEAKPGTVKVSTSPQEVLVKFDEEIAGERAWYVHPKQCRRLKPKAKREPRRIQIPEVQIPGAYCVGTVQVGDYRVTDFAQKLVEFVEVIKKGRAK